jgi:predicted transcriptional regulator
LYENKYLEAFKKFSNDYQFTDQEIQEERDTFIKMKTENLLYIEQNKTKLQAHLDVIDGILKNTFEDEIDDEVKNKLVEYYQLDEEDPDEIAFDELYLELITEKVEKDLKKAFIHGRNVSTDLIYQGEDYLPEKEKERR